MQLFPEFKATMLSRPSTAASAAYTYADPLGAPTTTWSVDTLGWDELLVLVGTGDVANIAACCLYESDATGASASWSKITDAEFGVTTLENGSGAAISLPSGADNKLYGVKVNLAGGSRKRYIALQLTAGEGTNLTFAIGITYRKRARVVRTDNTVNAIATGAGLVSLLNVD